MKEIVQVTAAVLEKDGKYFIAQRKLFLDGRKREDPLSGKWEFPGGKIEPGETPEECLARELKEELGIEVTVHEYLGSTVHHYDHISIELMAYRATWVGGAITVKDHHDYRWVSADELDRFEFLPADIPFVEMLKS